MRAVNLLPKEFQAHKSLREEDPAVVVGSALAVVVLIALGASFLVAHGKAGTEQKRLTAARLALAQLSTRKVPVTHPKKPAAPITPIVPPPTIVGDEAAWLTAVSSTLSQRIAWDRVLREVSLVMPDDVTLSSLTMTAPTPVGAIPGAAAAPAQGFVIDGSAFSYPSVARLLSRLGLVPDLSAVTLTNSSADKGGVAFSITATVKGAPAPPAPAPTTPAATDTTATTTSPSA
jgi:hypothetical protein